MNKPAQARVVGKLSDAQEGVAGVVACAGCRSTRGTLEGTTFRCLTPTCKFFKSSAPASPWVKRKL